MKWTKSAKMHYAKFSLDDVRGIARVVLPLLPTDLTKLQRMRLEMGLDCLCADIDYPSNEWNNIKDLLPKMGQPLPAVFTTPPNNSYRKYLGLDPKTEYHTMRRFNHARVIREEAAKLGIDLTQHDLPRIHAQPTEVTISIRLLKIKEKAVDTARRRKTRANHKADVAVGIEQHNQRRSNPTADARLDITNVKMGRTNRNLRGKLAEAVQDRSEVLKTITDLSSDYEIALGWGRNQEQRAITSESVVEMILKENPNLRKPSLYEMPEITNETRLNAWSHIIGIAPCNDDAILDQACPALGD
jgi:hypothetical protein